MNTTNRFNLIDEPWVPVVGVGRVSLRQLFSKLDYQALGGNPIEKISLIKLLLAIAQSACTPENDEEWKKLGAKGLSDRCLAYLESMYDRFWLYGEKPFLQMPKIVLAKSQSFGAVLPTVATGNTTILNETQAEKPLLNADKALLLVSLMGYALGGKKADTTITLSENNQDKKQTARPGSFLGSIGFLHSFLLSGFLLETLWINLFTKKDLKENLHSIFPHGLGIAPWEKMPEREDCPTAKVLQTSLMGRLLPISRFILLNLDTLHYAEGIQYQDYQKGGIDPSTTICFSGKTAKAIWTDPEKRPWRHLVAMLSFMGKTNNKESFDCYQIKHCMGRAREANLSALGIWSGGLKVSNKAGEQYASGSDDFVDSSLLLPTDYLGEEWYEQLKQEMGILNEMSEILRKSIKNFYESQKMKADKSAKAACHLFWQLCESHFGKLLKACDKPEEAKSNRQDIFLPCAYAVYNQFCPKNTARQLDLWAKHLPNLNKYFQK